MAEQLPNLDIFKSVSTVTHGIYGIESDYNTITSGKERNSIDQPYSNTKQRFSKDSKKQDPRYLIFQNLNGFLKKKNIKQIYYAFRKIKDLQPVNIGPVKRQTKSEQQSQLIKFLLEQNSMNKKTLEERFEMIQKQKEELQEKQNQLLFVKNHYQYIFLRKIEEILNEKNQKNLEETFKKMFPIK